MAFNNTEWLSNISCAYLWLALLQSIMNNENGCMASNQSVLQIQFRAVV